MSQLIDSSITCLGDFIESSLQKFAAKPAFSCLGQTLTFSDIDKKSNDLACWLQQYSGLQAGDRIVIQLPNISQYPVVPPLPKMH